MIVPVGTIHAPYTTSDATMRLDDYLGSLLYENGTAEDAAHHPLTKVLTPEGYVDYATPGKPYCYFRKDHLGSIREVDIYLGNDRKVVQKTQYYPSGTPFLESFKAGEQPYKFTGKEMITMHGLNWQDYGARWLDNVRLQWTSVDPLAEKYYSISPYAYCAGNPVNRIDPDGMSWGVTIEQRDGGNPPMNYQLREVTVIGHNDSNNNSNSSSSVQFIYNANRNTPQIPIITPPTPSFNLQTNPKANNIVINKKDSKSKNEELLNTLNTFLATVALNVETKELITKYVMDAAKLGKGAEALGKVCNAFGKMSPIGTVIIS